MAKYLTKKALFYRLIIPAAAASGVLMLLFRLLAGPYLGSEYDFLAGFRPSPPIAREILIIETGTGAQRVLSPAVAGQIVLTLTEFSASKLIILSPVLGIHSDEQSSGSELVFHVDEEFKTINSNIKNLFDGIRLGSIAPQDAPSFVTEVLRLTSQSKERLLLSAARSLEADEARMEKAITVFGEVRVPTDIQVALAGSRPDETRIRGIYTAGYSRTTADADGKVRRIIPFIKEAAESEHVVWAAFKTQKNDNNSAAQPFPALSLDSTGSLIFETPKNGADFRTIPLSLFLEYEDLDKTLNKLLAAELSLATYADIMLERYPPFLYKKAEEECDKLLELNENGQRERWITARNAYWASLAHFFTGDIRRNIENSFEKLAKDEQLDETGMKKLFALRDDELQKYDIAQDVYHELALAHEKLEAALHDSFCILGSTENAGTRDGARWEGESPVRVSALLANTLFTGAVITVVDQRDAILRPALAALCVILIMLKLRLAASAVMTLLAAIPVYAGFCYAFIFSGEWLDPLIPALTVIAAALASLTCALVFRVKMAAQIKLEFGAVVSPQCLRRITGERKALPEKDTMMRAAIVAIRSPALNFIETKENAQTAVKKLEQFRAEVKDLFVQNGAVIIACDGDTVIAAFGSPLERFALPEGRKTKPYNDGEGWEDSSANKAARLIQNLPPQRAQSGPWCFGIDWGECNFTWSALTGYTAAGRPVARARLLSRLCPRYKTKTLITVEASRKINPDLIQNAPAPAHSKPRAYFSLTAKTPSP